jgi:hypothetical protein
MPAARVRLARPALLAATAFAAFFGGMLDAQQTASAPPPAAQVGSQSQDPDFAKAVREWTTAPEFLSPLVDHLPEPVGNFIEKHVPCYFARKSRYR